MATSSKRAYAISRAAAPKPLPLQQPTADPYLHRRHSLKGRSCSVSVGPLGTGAHKVLTEPSEHVL